MNEHVYRPIHIPFEDTIMIWIIKYVCHWVTGHIIFSLWYIYSTCVRYETCSQYDWTTLYYEEPMSWEPSQKWCDHWVFCLFICDIPVLSARNNSLKLHKIDTNYHDCFLQNTLSFLVHLSRRLKCTIVITRCPSTVVNFSNFRLLTGSKIWTSSTKFVFFGPIGKQDGCPGLWLDETFSTSLWNRWTEFNETWQEARSQGPLPNLCFWADWKNKKAVFEFGTYIPQ